MPRPTRSAHASGERWRRTNESPASRRSASLPGGGRRTPPPGPPYRSVLTDVVHFSNLLSEARAPSRVPHGVSCQLLLG